MTRMPLIAALRAAFLLLTALFFAPYAAAHAHLTSQTPAENSVLDATPAQLVLVFSEGIEPRFSKVRLYGPQNQEIRTGKPNVDGSGHTTLQLVLEESLSQGQYRVEWQVVSVDGHKTTGKYSFSVK